ncbi:MULTISPECIES: winged helix-turn-helix domain-containing protein [Serratia]|uniref:winged helix-turn-helix domain-containing protein n=1 Tax=Serratia TaxID=613 RepID=UPI000AFBDE09|nr:winged helix-turn-helix domain-containing protein [Serratia marcescens]MDT8208564.1 winged helix-turn-helix domain-containing protein [Serratia marcescens]
MGVNQFIAQGIMRYIINNNIKYHEDRSELISLHDDIPPVVLTATLNRLLSALVRNNNLVLSRETLLTQVWEAHGQVASGNNLNNTISILRKAFSSLGEEEIIVTLPRQGFMFTAAELHTMDSQAESLLVPDLQPAAKPAAVATVTQTRRFKFTAVVLALLALGSGIGAWWDAGYPAVSVAKVGKIGNCDVQFITSFHRIGPVEVDLTHLQNMLEQKKHTKCNENGVPATLFYYDSKMLTPNSPGRVRSYYFYYCPQSRMASGKVQCENFHENIVL